MKALVTGATGFAGTWLCRHLLSQGFDVVGWARQAPTEPVSGVSYRSVDIRGMASVRPAMEECRPAVVYHLAAMADPRACEKHPSDAVAINVQGTKHVFSTMPQGARGLHVSTCHVYGQAPPVPILADTPVDPAGVYAETKALADQWVEQSNLPVVIARAFHHTGPGQSETFALADWCAQIQRGSDHVVTGNLRVRRDYCDVRDIVHGYTVLAKRGEAGRAYHLCSGRAESMKTLLSWAIGNRTVEVMTDPNRTRSRDVAEFRGDPTAAEGLGWCRAHSIRHTLAAMAKRTEN